MRQKNDPVFQLALNNFADGRCTCQDLKFFETLQDASEKQWQITNKDPLPFLLSNWQDLDDVTAAFHRNKYVPKHDGFHIQTIFFTEMLNFSIISLLKSLVTSKNTKHYTTPKRQQTFQVMDQIGFLSF